MATIVQGPVERLRVAATHETDRLAAALFGLVMLVPVSHMQPGLARVLVAVAAGVFIGGAVWPRRHASTPVSVDDLVEIEREILRTREEVQRRTGAVDERLDGIRDLVAEIADQLR